MFASSAASQSSCAFPSDAVTLTKQTGFDILNSMNVFAVSCVVMAFTAPLACASAVYVNSDAWNFFSDNELKDRGAIAAAIPLSAEYCNRGIAHANQSFHCIIKQCPDLFCDFSRN